MAIVQNKDVEQAESEIGQEKKVKVVFAKPFKFSPNGVEIIEYLQGEAEVSERCAEVAKQAKVLKK